jgi:hypothetical protein
MYQMNTKCAEWSQNIPNIHKIFQTAIKYVSIFQSEALEFFLKIGFLVWKQTIWQPWPFISNSLLLKRRALGMEWLKLSARGCQMVYFQTKNPELGKFWMILQWKMLVYNWWPFCQFSSNLVYFMAIWYNFPHFGIFFTVLVCCTKKNLATPAVARPALLLFKVIKISHFRLSIVCS